MFWIRWYIFEVKDCMRREMPSIFLSLTFHTFFHNCTKFGTSWLTHTFTLPILRVKGGNTIKYVCVFTKANICILPINWQWHTHTYKYNLLVNAFLFVVLFLLRYHHYLCLMEHLYVDYCWIVNSIFFFLLVPSIYMYNGGKNIQKNDTSKRRDRYMHILEEIIYLKTGFKCIEYFAPVLIYTKIKH